MRNETCFADQRNRGYQINLAQISTVNTVIYAMQHCRLNKRGALKVFSSSGSIPPTRCAGIILLALWLLERAVQTITCISHGVLASRRMAVVLEGIEWILFQTRLLTTHSDRAHLVPLVRLTGGCGGGDGDDTSQAPRGTSYGPARVKNSKPCQDPLTP